MGAMNAQEYEAKSQELLIQAKAIVANPEATAEEMGNAKKMLADAQEFKERGATLLKLEADIAAQSKTQDGATEVKAGGFKHLGDFLTRVWLQSVKNLPQRGLQYLDTHDDDDGAKVKHITSDGRMETKDLVESVGASGGFLVPPEYRNELLRYSDFMKLVRERATVIRMSRRQMLIPVLDQTGTSSTHNNFNGGVIPYWTAEGGWKYESDPQFRQLDLIAHKLVCVTETSDELLDDSAIPLSDLLSGLFTQAIEDELEYTYVLGTGAGQPLGIANVACGATIAEPRAVANQINLADVTNMLTRFMGRTPIWIAHQATMPWLLALNGPAGNPSYVWIGNGRDAMPTTLFGYPIYFVQNAATLGQRGDLILADWSKYIIGERQSVTIDSTNAYNFKYDLATWRAVSRYAGRPWLSAPLTLRDGATEVSPFVVLDSTVAST